MPLLAEISWEKSEKAFERTDVALIPTGALHDHGQSPLGVDHLIPIEIAKRLAQKTNIIVCPPISYGYNPSYMGWHPGSITVRPQCLYDLGYDICDSLYKWGIRKVIFLNGHGGSTPIFENIARTMYLEEHRMLIAIVEWWNLVKEIFEPVREVLQTKLKHDKHTSANFIEASGALSVDPNCVDLERIRTVTLKPIFGSKIIPIKTTLAKFENGTIKLILRNMDIEQDEEKICAASKEIGDDMINTVTGYLTRFIKEFKKLKLPTEI